MPKKGILPRKCKGCPNTFTPPRLGGMYCSKACGRANLDRHATGKEGRRPKSSRGQTAPLFTNEDWLWA